MDQIAFMTGLHLIGIVLGLNFRRSMPFPFICLTAFLGGAMLWVLINVCCLLISSPSKASLAISMAAAFVVLFSLLILRANWRLNITEIRWLAGTLALFILIAGIFARYNLSIGSTDSQLIIQMGREVILHGPDSWGVASPSSYGVFIPLLQSASVYLGIDYLYALQPTLGLMFLLSFTYLNMHLISYLINSRRLAIGLAILSTAALISAYFVFFQLFYIHTNLISAIFLYYAVCAFWLWHMNRNNVWLALAILTLAGFSLSRIENIIFALIVSAIAINSSRISYRGRLYAGLPFLTFFSLWYLKINALPSSAAADVLNAKIVYAIVFMLIAYGVLILLSNQDWIRKNIMAKLDQIICVVFCIGLSLMFLARPMHMITSLINLSTNLFSTGGWGLTWILLIGLLMLAGLQPSFPDERFFKYVIFLFPIFVMLMVFLRLPYHDRWSDSANRMMTTILPIAHTYILLKYGQSFRTWSEYKRPANSVCPAE